jgi:hypothetical protein
MYIPVSADAMTFSSSFEEIRLAMLTAPRLPYSAVPISIAAWSSTTDTVPELSVSYSCDSTEEGWGQQ